MDAQESANPAHRSATQAGTPADFHDDSRVISTIQGGRGEEVVLKYDCEDIGSLGNLQGLGRLFGTHCA
jgi:hypothetical protein